MEDFRFFVGMQKIAYLHWICLSNHLGRSWSLLTFMEMSGISVTFSKVLEVIKRKPGLKRISFVAHSVGGLVARFVIGKLYRPYKGGSIEQVSTNECKEESKGLIADLEPVNFITVATPHLGSRGNKQLLQEIFDNFIIEIKEKAKEKERRRKDEKGL